MVQKLEKIVEAIFESYGFGVAALFTFGFVLMFLFMIPAALMNFVVPDYPFMGVPLIIGYFIWIFWVFGVGSWVRKNRNKDR